MFAAALIAVIKLTAAASSLAQDVPYVATPPEAVERMLQLAQVRAGDVVYDLGCGDGRIVIAAVQTRGVRGVCVELLPERLRWARDNAQAAGVAERIRFVEGNFFEVPLQDATVVMLFLSRPVNLRLRPRLQKELAAGARVVSYAWDMGDWEPESTLAAGMPFPIYRWVIPTRPPR